jgi:aspartate/methionine/tyrosine aminotransferase
MRAEPVFLPDAPAVQSVKPAEPQLDISREAAVAPASGIAEVFQYGRTRQGIMPLYVGEGDLPTPDFVVAAISESMARGETFYGHQRGLINLREAIAAYMSRVYGDPFESSVGPFGPDRITVTMGGIHAIQCAVRLIANAGDEIIVPTPIWTNFLGVIAVAGATPVTFPLTLTRTGPAEESWGFDIERLAASITPRTRALVINTPANPTGWTASRADLEALLDLARRHGLWIIADEIYGRIVYSGTRAASFHDIMEADDRILFIQTFSKNWAMTGLRLGWLEAHPSLGPSIEKLMQYSTSGVSTPYQRGGVAALERGEDFVALQLRRMRQSRDIICDGLAKTGRVRFAWPEGAFYLFPAIEGETDTRGLAFRLIDEADVGVAPGSAFGPGGSDHVRICFARDPRQMEETVRRLTRWLAR